MPSNSSHVHEKNNKKPLAYQIYLEELERRNKTLDDSLTREEKEEIIAKLRKHDFKTTIPGLSVMHAEQKKKRAKAEAVTRAKKLRRGSDSAVASQAMAVLRGKRLLLHAASLEAANSNMEEKIKKNKKELNQIYGAISKCFPPRP